MITTLITLAFIGAAQQQAPDLTEDLKKVTVESLAEKMEHEYVFPKLGAQVKALLLKNHSDGKYDEIKDGNAFAGALLEDVNTVIHDKHFMFWFSARRLEGEMKPGPEYEAERRVLLRRHNGLVKEVKHLAGNIGLFKIDALLDPEHIVRPLSGAMKFLQETDAMIIDLRDNGGGVPEAVQLICSYFLQPAPILLETHYWKPTDEETEYWSLPKVDGERYLDKPLFILTSEETASGAEGLAYVLKHLGRATIVGERTWGGSHPGTTMRISEHFASVIPMGYTVVASTGKDWEETGVLPDVEVPSGEALIRAQILALQAIIERSTDEEWNATLQARIEELTAANQ